MAFSPKLTQAILLIIIVVMPIAHHISRFEANEAHRAGLLSILIIGVSIHIPTLIPKLKQAQKMLLFSIAFYILALVISTAFSLSPIHSLFGDSIRRMGLLTHLSVIAVIFLMWGVSGKQLWFYLWIGALLIATQIFLETTELNEALIRIQGLFGWGTFTGGWLMAATIWTVIGFFAYGYQKVSSTQRGFVVGSILIIGFAFIILGSRAAALGTVIGLFFAGWIWAVKTRQRRLLLAVVGLVIVVGGSIFALSRIQYVDSPLSSTFLLQRLKFPVLGSFREQIWQDSMKIVVTNPQLTRYDGSTDALWRFRPFVGYGAELFEVPHRATTLSNIPAVVNTLSVDRAHNIWYDTYIAHGILGCIGLVSVYLMAIGVALKRLKLLNRRTILSSMIGCALGILFTPSIAFVPVTATFGTVGGLGFGIFLSFYFYSPSDTSLSVNALIAISVLIAHIIEAQFGFITVATALIPWLAIGLLFVDEQNQDDLRSIPQWVWLSIVGAFVIRIPLGNVLHNGLLLIVALSVYLLWERTHRDKLLFVCIIWGIATLNWVIKSPELTLLWDIGLLVIAILLIYTSQVDSITITLNMQTTVFGFFFLLISVIWCMDILAGNYRLLSTRTALAVDRLHYINSSSILRPYDFQLLRLASSENLSYGVLAKDNLALGRSINLLRQSITINGFNSDATIALALLESQLAVVTDEREMHIERAKLYFSSATMMWRQAGSYWREWARFELEIVGDVDSAKEKIAHAIRLMPDDPSTLKLLEDISLASN